MVRPTTLVEDAPGSFRHDEATNLVYWTQTANGHTHYFAMPEPVWRQSIFGGVRLIKTIDKARRERAASETVVPLKRRGAGGGNGAARES